MNFHFIGGDIALASVPPAENIKCIEGDEFAF